MPPKARPDARAVFAGALAYHQAGRLEEASQFYREVLVLVPRHADSLHLLGLIARQHGQQAQALELIGRAVAIQPTNPAFQCSFGDLLGALGRLEQALACYRAAVATKPGWAEAHCALGSTLRDLGQLEAAVACQREAIALKPDHVPAHNNLGTALRELGRPDEAVAACRMAVTLGAGFPQPHINLGNALRDQGGLEEAIGCYRTALRIEPDNADTHNNLAMALLAGGRMAEGWVEHEWRWQTAQMAASRRSFAQPQWRGEPASGRTLLIHAEQGFGDSLQFCRYATLAAERGLRVILEVPKPLVRLLRSLDGVARVLASGEPLPAFDLHCSMMSLPLALGTTEGTIPHAASYLRADAAQAAGWSARLAAAEGLRVGLLWAGNARSHSPHMVALDRRRSLAPERLAPLLSIPGVRYFSLQKDPPRAPDTFRLADHMGEMTDFADTAALVANLDLVISADTAVAHLAAALGRPVWVMDRFDPCWRWPLGRTDSAWYPSLRLYRQARPGAWDPVIAAIAQDLRGLADTATSRKRP